MLKVIKQGGLARSEDVVLIPDLPAPPASAGGEEQPQEEPSLEINLEYIREEEARALQNAQERAEAAARQMMDDAGRQREQLLEQARQEGEALRQQARQEGYDAAYHEYAGKVDGAIEQMGQLLDRMEAQQKAFIEDYQKNLKTLAVDIAEKVLSKRIGEDSGEMVELVRQAVSTIRSADWISVEVSDQLQGLVELLTKELPALANGARVDVTTRDGPPGTCIVNTPEMVLDASVGVQLENLRGVLDGME